MAMLFTSDLHLGHNNVLPSRQQFQDLEVYGHIKRYQPHALNAGVDINGFEPVTFENLKENNNRWYERGQEDKKEKHCEMMARAYA